MSEYVFKPLLDVPSVKNVRAKTEEVFIFALSSTENHLNNFLLERETENLDDLRKSVKSENRVN